jgi:hypothetical protein
MGNAAAPAAAAAVPPTTTATAAAAVPPVPTLPNLDKGRDLGASKLRTGCKEHAEKSLACKVSHPELYEMECKALFDVYKECKKNEHEALIAERRKRFNN